MGPKIVRFSVTALVAAYAATVAAAGAKALWDHEPIGWSTMWRLLAVNPIEMDTWPYYAFAIIMLAAEPAMIGWRKSSLRRLLVVPGPSAATDAIYCAISASGLMVVLVAVAGVGIGTWLAAELSRNMGYVLRIDGSRWLTLPAAYLWVTLIDYLQHRVMHSRLMWPLHQSHHSSTEFTVLSAFRFHPLDSMFTGLMFSVSLTLVGFAPETMLTLQVMIYLTNVFTHSNLTCLAALERLGLTTPAGHRLHHSSEPRYHDCNFGGASNVWDRLFGTYMAPPPDIDFVRIGVDGLPGRHNTLNPFREIGLQTLDWMSPMRRVLPSLKHRVAGSAKVMESAGRG